MITKEQAMKLKRGQIIHQEGCIRNVGPRGGIQEKVTQWRVNGVIKLWKRTPSVFVLPIKYGLKTCHYLSPANNNLFHLEADCPIRSTDNEETTQNIQNSQNE